MNKSISTPYIYHSDGTHFDLQTEHGQLLTLLFNSIKKGRHKVDPFGSCSLNSYCNKDKTP